MAAKQQLLNSRIGAKMHAEGHSAMSKFLSSEHFSRMMYSTSQWEGSGKIGKNPELIVVVEEEEAPLT